MSKKSLKEILASVHVDDIIEIFQAVVALGLATDEAEVEQAIVLLDAKFVFGPGVVGRFAEAHDADVLRMLHTFIAAGLRMAKAAKH